MVNVGRYREKTLHDFRCEDCAAAAMSKSFKRSAFLRMAERSGADEAGNGQVFSRYFPAVIRESLLYYERFNREICLEKIAGKN